MHISIASLLRNLYKTSAYSMGIDRLYKMLPELEGSIGDVKAFRVQLNMADNLFKPRQVLRTMSFMQSLKTMNDKYPIKMRFIEESVKNSIKVLESAQESKAANMMMDVKKAIDAKNFEKEFPVKALITSADSALENLKILAKKDQPNWDVVSDAVKKFKAYYTASEPLILRGAEMPVPTFE
jgi:hypothetical protein